MDKLNLKPKVTLEKNSVSIPGFFSVLLNSVTQVHIFHFQTQSFSQHLALGDFYDKIADLADELIESYQGKYGIVKGYTSPSLKDISNPVGYFKDLHDYVEKNKTIFKDSDLLNIIDEVKTLIKVTLYKLENLK